MQRVLDIGGASGSGLVSMILHHVHAPDILRVARCCTFFRRVVMQPGAWKYCPDVHVRSLIRNTSLCTRHMPVAFAGPSHTTDVWLSILREFASSVRIQSFVFRSTFVDSSNSSNRVLNQLLLHSDFHSLLHLCIPFCDQDTGDVVAMLTRLHTLEIESHATSEGIACLHQLPRLTSLKFSDIPASPDHAKQWESCLSVVSTLPHLQELDVCYAFVSNVVAFCKAVAHTRRFTRLVVRHMRWGSERQEDIAMVTDFGPLQSVSVHGWGEASNALLRVLQGASALRELLLYNAFHKEIVQTLLRNNRDLCVTARPLTSSYAFSNETMAEMAHVQVVFPNRFLCIQR
jgi:hypothetical protein